MMNCNRPESEKDEKFSPVCVFVASSDNTKDVFRNVMASYGKFWGNCRYRKYVGLNSCDEEIGRQFLVVTAKATGWRAELLEQIDALPLGISHILLMLDDFLLLSPVDEERLARLIDGALEADFTYLRLVPRTSALVCRLVRRLKNSLTGLEITLIPLGEAYYSSLQPALWKREHLVAMLRLSGTIWEFENQAIPGAKHYATTHTPPLRCVHVVEKGAWMPDAALRFKKLALPFAPGRRQQRSPTEIPLLWYRRFKFSLFGYTGMRIRRIVAKAASRSGGEGRVD